MQATYPPGSVFKPVTALAAMQEHLVSPYAYLPCTGTYHVAERQGAPGRSTTGTRTSISRWTCRPRSPTRATRTSTNSATRSSRCRRTAASRCRSGRRTFGFGTSTGVDVGPEAPGLVPTIGWRRQLLHTTVAHRQALEAGRLDPARDRPGRPARDAAADGALLRAARERRQARDAARADGRREPERHARAGARALPRPEASASTRRRSRSSGRACGRRRTCRSGRRTRLRHSSRSRSPARRARRRRSCRCPATSGLQDQSWWCGYGPTDEAKLVVCAVIENGGHGGTAAAPAAAEVFASYFHVKVQPDHPEPLRLIGTMD